MTAIQFAETYKWLTGFIGGFGFGLGAGVFLLERLAERALDRFRK